MIYLAESAPFSKRGLITSFAGSGSSLGFLLATLMIILFKNIVTVDYLTEWLWRIPFFILGLIGTIIFIFRLNLTETTSYQYLKSSQQLDQKPLLVALRYAPYYLLKISALTCISSTFYILFFGYMPKYITQFSAKPMMTALNIQSILLFAMLFLIPCGGMLGAYFGRKNILTLTCSAMILLAFPLFYLLNSHHIALIILALAIATLLSAFDQGCNLAAFVENCPLDVRYSGLSFSYNMGNALFGGTTPLVLNLIINDIHVYAPAYFLISYGIVSMIAILTLLPKQSVKNIGFLSQA